jgi:uncharacterized protein (TIGR02145 family)
MVMNKNVISRLLNVGFLIVGVLVLFSCKKSENPAPVASAPLVTTNTPIWIGREWATFKGEVNGRDQLTTVTFEYDTTTSYGYSVSPVPDTTARNKYITFTVTVTGLIPNTKYHYRISAVNPTGAANGSDVTFSTTDTSDININFNPDLIYDSIYDSENNKYRTIQIGMQTWMAENLRSVKLNDGTDISFVIETSSWAELTTPGYCWYNNDSVGYGAIYNWSTVKTGKLCPSGWHVPTDEEWTILTDYLGGKSAAGGKLKETGYSHWLSPNTGATNESGFTGLPTGYRSSSGSFNNIGSYGFWWTSTEASAGDAYYRRVYYSYSSVDRSSSNKKSGTTVRCIKD